VQDKPTIKPKKCRVCKVKFTPARPLQAVCSPVCALEHAKAKPTKKQARPKKSERLASMTYAQKLNELQAVFNKMRRAEELLYYANLGEPPRCISCGKTKGNDAWACGHFKSRGARPDLRFDRLNTYLQHNHRCNQMLGGDIKNFELGIIKRHGGQATEILTYLDTVQNHEKLTDEQIINTKKTWAATARKLEKRLENYQTIS
jgi:hypothetical protein